MQFLRSKQNDVYIAADQLVTMLNSDPGQHAVISPYNRKRTSCQVAARADTGSQIINVQRNRAGVVLWSTLNPVLSELVLMLVAFGHPLSAVRFGSPEVSPDQERITA